MPTTATAMRTRRRSAGGPLIGGIFTAIRIAMGKSVNSRGAGTHSQQSDGDRAFALGEEAMRLNRGLRHMSWP
jgi:hypothetical protein